MEFLPHMALLLSEEPHQPPLKALIVSHLLPAVVKALADPNGEVLKMAENALFTMLEHCLVPGDYIEQQVWPVIIKGLREEETSKSTPLVSKSALGSAVTIIPMMSKMAPWIGSEITGRLFTPLLIEFSSSPEFFVRRMCALIFGEICAVVGIEITEGKLLPSFLKLCADEEWKIRKTCAESFMSVSCAVSMEVRKAALAPVFAKLLTDSTRWVQLAAFQSLGPFITTFAQSSVTLDYNSQRELILKHSNGFEFKLNSKKSGEDAFDPIFSAFWVKEGEEDEVHEFYMKEKYKTIYTQSYTATTDSHISSNNNLTTEVRQNDEELFQVNGEALEEETYNQFNFWRDPILNIDVCGEIVEEVRKPAPRIQEKDKLRTKNKSDVYPLVEILKDLGILNEPSPLIKHKGPEEGKQWIGRKQQDIVPEELIHHFVSMSEPQQDKATELAHHCAYNLPAVALTLGPENWTLLKGAYETLAADRQWKVRRIVASSIHELAVIVGEDVATQDLVPVFNGFIKDLDEVRIGALKHLAHFLRLLRPAGRNSFLPRLAEFLMTDYDWNWRFREELGAQLIQALGLFTPSDTCHHLTPVAISLLLDKVAYVRKVALHLVTELVNHVSIDVGLLRGLLAELAAQFAHSSRWNRRQTFAFLCARLLSERVLSEEMFGRDVLPHLLDLSWDRVPNVRLAVAKVLALHAMANSYFADPLSPHHEILSAVLKRLQGDRDRDVRYFASLPPQETIVPQTAEIKD